MTRRPRVTCRAPVALAFATLIVSALPYGWSARAAAQDSSAQIDALVQEAIKAGQTPGAVVLVGHGDEILFQKAYGQRAVVPSAEPMTMDTIFDLASLTKVVATTTAVMRLVEQGRIRLNDPVATFVPGFERYNKGAITVRHLLTHVSGLRPDVDLGDPWKGHDAAIELARNEVPTAAPGERFVYSDINFFLLGDIVSRVSGLPLDQYLQRDVFGPLDMDDTGFNPPASKRGRIAPTERCAEMSAWPCNNPEAAPLRGTVHDPTARRMGGVAGHAGLFSTARDLSRFARMLLNEGRLGDSAGPVALDGGEDAIAGHAGRHAERARPGLGHRHVVLVEPWRALPDRIVRPHRFYRHVDLDRSFDARLRDLPVEPTASGRQGRRHAAALTRCDRCRGRTRPFGRDRGDRAPERRHAAADDRHRFRRRSRGLLPPAAPVSPGIDVLARDGFALLKGRRVGLITNHTGRSAGGASTIDVLHKALGAQLVALFSPEHGIRGILDDNGANRARRADGTADSFALRRDAAAD